MYVCAPHILSISCSSFFFHVRANERVHHSAVAHMCAYVALAEGDVSLSLSPLPLPCYSYHQPPAPAAAAAPPAVWSLPVLVKKN